MPGSWLPPSPGHPGFENEWHLLLPRRPQEMLEPSPSRREGGSGGVCSHVQALPSCGAQVSTQLWLNQMCRQEQQRQTRGVDDRM